MYDSLLLLPVYACPCVLSPKVATTQVRSSLCRPDTPSAQGVVMCHPPVFDCATCRCISNLSFYFLNKKHVLRNLCCGAPRHTLSDQDLKSPVPMGSPDHHTVWAAIISPVLDLALQISPANKRRDEHPVYAWACSPQTIQQVCGPPPAGQRKGLGNDAGTRVQQMHCRRGASTFY